jgi:hypothetical protein
MANVMRMDSRMGAARAVGLTRLSEEVRSIWACGERTGLTRRGLSVGSMEILTLESSRRAASFRGWECTLTAALKASGATLTGALMSVVREPGSEYIPSQPTKNVLAEALTAGSG